MLMMWCDDNEEGSNCTQEDRPLDTETSDKNVEGEHHLSLNALKGSSCANTLRFQGQIGNITVQILVDGGSSDNFLQPRIAQFLKLPIEPAPCFKVLVGNGQYMVAEGQIKQLPVIVQGHELLVPVHLLPVAGADLVLGTTWLATLGAHVADYSNMSLRFVHQGKFITLQGERNTAPRQAQLHHLRRMHNTCAIQECFTIQLLQSNTSDDDLKELPEDIDPELDLIIHSYREVFQTPVGLPPQREQDHVIPLKDGAAPVKV